MTIRKFVLGALVVMALSAGAFQCAHAAKSADSYTPTADNTASIVVLQLDDDVRGFIFISKTGETSAVSYSQCSASAKCQTILSATLKAEKVTILTVPTGCKEPTNFTQAKF